jgi:alkylated DNA nucleotide flippase Atl1
MSDRLAELSDLVLDVVDRIPAGRVMTFGAIADYLGRGGPRGVAGVMARHGMEVAWWRVVRVDGTLPPYLMVEAQPHWLIEGTPLRRGLVDVRRAQWQPDLPEPPVSGAPTDHGDPGPAVTGQR